MIGWFHLAAHIFAIVQKGKKVMERIGRVWYG
jgi:hypothetical protein